MEEILLLLEAESNEDAHALGTWLRADPKLMGKMRLRSAGESTGAMGPSGDALVATLGGSGALAAFAQCLKVWITSYYHQRRRTVKIQITTKSGEKISLTADNADDGERLLHHLLENS